MVLAELLRKGHPEHNVEINFWLFDMLVKLFKIKVVRKHVSFFLSSKEELNNQNRCKDNLD